MNLFEMAITFKFSGFQGFRNLWGFNLVLQECRTASETTLYGQSMNIERLVHKKVTVG